MEHSGEINGIFILEFYLKHGFFNKMFNFFEEKKTKEY